MSNRALECSITKKESSSDSCIIFLSGKEIVQIGNCCTVVEIKVNDAVVQWLENTADDSPAELNLDLGNLGICTLVWNNKECLQEKWKVELKSELSEELSHLKNKVLKKITYLHGKLVADIAKEFYETFRAKLEKISPGCICIELSLEAVNSEDATTKIEEMRKRLEIVLQDIIKDDTSEEHGYFTTKVVYADLLSRRNNYDKCKGGTCLMTAENISDYFPKERDRGVYTLLCLDGSDISKNPGLRECLRQLYLGILEDLDETHCDECVTFNEFVSLIAVGGNGKIHIEQPFQAEFPQDEAFDHVIDEVVGCDVPLDASQILSTLFQIASKHGQNFQKEGCVIHTRIVFITNGTFKEQELTTLPTMYPVSFVPIDQNCDKGLLKKIISNTGGEITADIKYISQYAKYLQFYLNGLQKGKRDNNEILETIKEHSPGVIKDMDNFLKAYKLSVPVEKTQRFQTEAADQEALVT